MKILIVGSGGREHAIAWKIAQSKKAEKIYCAPGNAGMEEYAECVDIEATELERLAEFAKQHQIDLTIIGMDDPLVAGIVDVFKENHLQVFGPSKAAAMIEGSKAFSKDLMKKYKIPTAEYEVFHNPKEAITYLEGCQYPIVIKADGLAFGKGVLICESYEEAKAGVRAMMEEKQFGNAGNTIVVEEYMTGREVSVLAFCDGTHIKPMTSAQDHKRAYDEDKGPNTGGMGTFSPSPFYTEEIHKFCEANIYQATMDAMKEEGRPFVGILFVGLMLTKKGPRVLEYNARFGDPEAQVVLPRMKNDLLDVILACIQGDLEKVQLEFEEDAAVCVMLASKGYPIHYEKGFEIKGIKSLNEKDCYIFHSGTKRAGDKILTNGGRVLGITAKGKDLKLARQRAYEAVSKIEFENKYIRNDIGKAIDQIDHF